MNSSPCTNLRTYDRTAAVQHDLGYSNVKPVLKMASTMDTDTHDDTATSDASLMDHEPCEQLMFMSCGFVFNKKKCIQRYIHVR